MPPGFSRYGTSALYEEMQHGTLFACLGVSIALHAAVLFALPGLRPIATAGNSKALTATFASTPVKLQAQVAVTRPLSRSRQEANFETQPPILATSSAPLVAHVPRPAEPTPLHAPIPETAGAAPKGADTSDAREAPATLGQSTEQHLIERADAGLLEEYRLALIDAAKRYKRYPMRAVEEGWKGRVEIRLVVGSSGTIKNALVKRSSNYRILDDQALDMVKKSAKAEPIPPALRGREFTLDIPVIFELQAG